MPKEAAVQKVIVANAGIQHSFRTAMALQEGEMLGAYLTSFWYSPERFPFSMLQMLPASVKNRLLREFRKRSFPLLNDSLVKTHPLLTLFSHAAMKCLGASAWSRWFDWLINREFDLWARRQIGEIDCDLYIGYETSALRAFRACKGKGIPCIFDLPAVHWKFLEKSRVPTGPMSPRLFRRLAEIQDAQIALSDFILTPSAFAQRTLLDAGVNPQKIIKLPYGVDLSRFAPKNAYRKEGEFKIVFSGSDFVQKGADRLMNAFRKLNLEGTRLLLIGWGREASRHFGALPPDCEMLPSVSQEELPKYFRDADLFVLPSFCDSFGLAPLEAMACGTPVIVTDQTGICDWVRNDREGYVIRPGNEEQLADRIRFLYGKRGHVEQMGRQARKQAENLSWKNYGQRLREIVTGILNPEKRGSIFK